MEYEKELLELKSIKNQIWRTKSKQKQIALINSYSFLASYLDNLKIADEEELFNDLNVGTDRYLKFFHQGKHNYVVEYINNIELISNIVTEILGFYHETPMIECLRASTKKVSFQNGIQKMIDLFKKVDSSIYQVYIDMIQSDNISMISSLKTEGLAFDSSFTGSPRIILEKRTNSYETLSALSHELGHCYEFITNRTKPNNFVKYNLNEVSSLFLQMIFDKHMMEDYEFSEHALKENLIGYICLYQQSLMADLTSKLIMSDFGIQRIDCNGIAVDKDILESIIGVESIKAYDNYGINMDNYLYILSNVVACNLYKVYENNPKEGIRLFKHFITTRQNYSLKELLEMYANDLTSIKKEISKASAYQKKLFHL